MPKTGFVVAIAIAVVAAFGLSTGAGAQQGSTDDPFFSCRSSVARLVLGGGSPIEPITANPNEKECADDAGGAPTIALPPPPAAPTISAKTVQATTDILCSEDNPNPDETTGNNDDCDAGEPTFEQQVVSRARVEDARVVAGSLDVRAQVANTEARSYCDPVTNVPVLESTSTVVKATINGSVVEIPPGPNPTTVDLGPLGKVIFNERVGKVDGIDTKEGPQADGAQTGELIRRAIHVQVPTDGSAVDAIVSESKADFHGDVCPEGRVVIRKETAPDEPFNTTAFDFTTTGLTPGSFDLTDDEQIAFEELLPGQYSVTETAPSAASGYELTLINCAENRTDDTTTNLASRTVNLAVTPGETVTCTFVNSKDRGVGAPPQCPPGSTPNELGQCVVDRSQCPPGSTFNQQGQCVIANVRCPDGTFFDPQTLSCLEAPQGGQLIPLGQLKGFVGSPCRAARFGLDFAIVGTNGSDKITGTNRSDRIFSLGGDDRVSGGRGDDCVEGGNGRDVLDGSNGRDYLIGGSGRDVLTGGPAKDQLVGGSGRDVLSGGTGNDVMRGGAGTDRLQGGFGSDRLIGGAGNDGINTGAGRDVVVAGPGNDVINAGTRGPAARVDCGPGKDRVRINNNERKRIKNCEFVDVFERIRSQGRPVRR